MARGTTAASLSVRRRAVRGGDGGAAGELFAPGADDVASIEGGGVLGQAVGPEEPGSDRRFVNCCWCRGVGGEAVELFGTEPELGGACVPAGAELGAFDVVVLGLAGFERGVLSSARGADPV